MKNSICHPNRLPRSAWLVMEMAMVAALGGWAAHASAQVANSPLFQPAPSAAPIAPPSWPAWQGVQDGSGGMSATYPAPYSGVNASMYPSTQPPVLSGLYPTDRTPALRDLTQRPASPLENAARDAGVRQQLPPAPANAPRYP